MIEPKFKIGDIVHTSEHYRKLQEQNSKVRLTNFGIHKILSVEVIGSLSNPVIYKTDRSEAMNEVNLRPLTKLEQALV